jgi:predicted aspartyl protease
VPRSSARPGPAGAIPAHCGDTTDLQHGADDVRTQVPFRLIGGGQPLIVLPARFGGSDPIDCALDTGASHVMLLPEIAERLGLVVHETRTAQGAGGPTRVQIATAGAVRVGDAVVNDVPVLLTDDLNRIGAAIGWRLGGTIGFGFLRTFRVTVDYARRELTLCTPDVPDDAGPARAELPFTLAHPSKPLIMLDVAIAGQPFRFALDTGASTTVISPDVARRCELSSHAMPAMTGGGGRVAASAAVLPSLELGGIRISRVRVVVAEFLDMLGHATGARIDGIVGTNVLRRFEVTIDYPGQSLRLM